MQMTTERSSNPIHDALNNTYSVKRQLLDNFTNSKEYRHAFVEEKVRTQLAIQIKTIREQRPLTRPEFAALLEKAPSWVFRLEDPNQPPPTISTLLQVAEAFDVDLEISFKSFSDLLNRLERLTPESFEVASFEEELKQGAFEERQSTAKLFILPAKAVGNTISNEKPQTPPAPGITQGGQSAGMKQPEWRAEPRGVINAVAGGAYARAVHTGS
jgi:transcriptional regulator with XRE-family HTH domain